MDIVPERFELASTTLDRVEGDPTLLKASENLLRLWFQEGDFDGALEYFDEACNHCPDHFLSPNQQKTASDEEARSRIREKLRIIRSGVEVGDSLGKSIRRLEPWNPDLRLISHNHEDAITLVSVPDGYAEPLLCEHRHRAHEMERSDVHGTYSAAIFQLNVRSDHPAAIILLWSKTGQGDWKVVSYHIEMH